jgi:ATP-dependent DNA helicase DinG
MQIKLRQGFGRAIRTETDTCVIAILDDRAAPEGRYHRATLEALPEMQCTSDLEAISQFMLEHKADQYFKEEKPCHDPTN